MTPDSALGSDGCGASSRLPTGLCGSRTRTDAPFYVLRHERGLAADEAALFLARGMLINTVLGLRLWEGEGRENASELLSFLLEEDAEDILGAAAGPRPER